jgi:hypothetical protein
MKKIYQSTLLLIFITSIIASCSKDKDSSGGEPIINYIRITDPLSSDSLLVGAGQGNLIVIVGENLQNTVEIWFNDQKAVLTSTYITNSSILVSVPSMIPSEISNRMKLIFSNGKTLDHDFKLQISEPLISGMLSEYVLTGEIATIRGNYFYEPLTVTFTGGVVAELESVEDNTLLVRVPEGALPGQITIKTNFGETKSDFWFRDNRNIFISSDPFTGWWNESFVVKDPGIDDPKAINGNYIRVKRLIGGWNWLEVAGGPPNAMGDISKNIPDEAILKPENYNLKFELNTLKPFNNNVLKINVGLSNDFNNDAFLFTPPIDTKGNWQTIVIPFEEIAKSYGSPLSRSDKGYYARLLFHGPGDLDADMSFDNFRVVPKTIKK